jgi:NitT/TauT family transport system substrate-binding protein
MIVGALLASGLTACGDDDDTSGDNGSSVEQIRLAVIPAFGSLPIHVADVQGFFEDAGLDVQTTETQDVPGAVAALGKQFDIALAAPPIMLAANAQGANLQGISGMQVVDQQHLNSVLVSKEPVNSFADLEEKSVGVIALSGGSIQSAQYLIQSEGGDPDKVNFSAVPLPTMADQVEAGRIDAAVSAVPFFTGLEGLAVGDQDVSAAAVEAVTDGAQTSTQTAMMATTKDWAAENPEAGEKFRKALADSIAWIEDNPAEAQTLVSEWTGLDLAVVEASPEPAYSATIDAETLEPLIQIGQEVGGLPPSVPPASEQVAPGADQEP